MARALAASLKESEPAARTQPSAAESTASRGTSTQQPGELYMLLLFSHLHKPLRPPSNGSFIALIHLSFCKKGLLRCLEYLYL